MCKLKFLLTSSRIKLGVFLSAIILARHAKSWSQKKRPRGRLHASLTSDLEHSDVFSVRFFSMCMYFVGCRLMKNKPLTVWNLFPYVFPTFGAQAITIKTATTMHLTKGFTCTVAFIFLHIQSLSYAKKQECNNQKFKVWEHKHSAM